MDRFEQRFSDRIDHRRLATTVVAALVVFGGGTIGFHLLLHEPLFDAFYRTVITATLTGLDTKPLRPGAQALTIGVIVGGVAIFGYLAAQAVEAIAHEIAPDARLRKRRTKMIDQLRNHFIICGYGRVGRRTAEEFVASGQPFVILDRSPDAVAVAASRGVLCLEGSGAEDADLMRVGIDRARGVVASADSDAENLYITLSARTRRPDLTIVARASDAEAERKLRLAGADRVVQPYSNAGVEIAKLALKPQVAAFLEIVSTYGGPDLRFEELEVDGNCRHVGQTIRDLRIRKETGALIVAIRRPDGTFTATPSPDTKIDAGSTLIAMGTEPELQSLEELFAPETVGSA